MKELRVIPIKPVVQVVEDGKVLAEVLNYTLHYIVSKGRALPATVDYYLQLDTMGDVGSLDELDEAPETRAEIEQLVKNGFLINTKSKRERLR
jgi:hypothetical protein